MDLVQTFRRQVPDECLARTHAKDGCSISLAGMSAHHVMVDVDCSALPLPTDAKRCDFLFVSEHNDRTWIALIELKRGTFSAGAVAAQLQGGAALADRWLPDESRFEFAPVVAHGRGIRQETLKALRKVAVRLRGITRRPKLIRCGAPLREALV